MTETAKLFRHGRSQAVRLPKAFRLPGTEVRVRRMGRSIVLEPIEDSFDVQSWRAGLQALGAGTFLAEGIPEDSPVGPDPRDYFAR